MRFLLERNHSIMAMPCSVNTYGKYFLLAVAFFKVTNCDLKDSLSVFVIWNMIFLVADFDKSTWKEDIVVYKKAAREIGVEVYLERSKSGNGGHAWIFFETFIPAYLARQRGENSELSI